MVTVIISQTSGNDKLKVLEIAQQSKDTYAALSSYTDTGTVVVKSSSGDITITTFTIRLQRPDLYRVDWSQSISSIPQSTGRVWSAGDGFFMQQSAGGRDLYSKPLNQHTMQMSLGAAAGGSSSASSTIPEVFFATNSGDVLDSVLKVASKAATLTKERDAKIGGVDCHTLTSTFDPSKSPDGGKLPEGRGTIGKITTTFWIGKQDHLIHQIRRAIDTSALAMASLSDATIKSGLERINQPATPEKIAAYRAHLEAVIKRTQGSGYVFTQTHENIVVNQKFSPADFAPENIK